MDRKASLSASIIVTLVAGCGLGYAMNKLEGLWAGILLGIIMLLIPFTIFGIYYVVTELRKTKKEV